MKWELPAPPSANRIWRKSGNRMHKSKAYNDWLEACSWVICSQRPVPIKGDAKMTIWMRPKDYRVRDLDNSFKPIGDLMERCRVVINDAQFTELHAYRMAPSGGVHDLVVEVVSLESTDT